MNKCCKPSIGLSIELSTRFSSSKPSSYCFEANNHWFSRLLPLLCHLPAHDQVFNAFLSDSGFLSWDLYVSMALEIALSCSLCARHFFLEIDSAFVRWVI